MQPSSTCSRFALSLLLLSTSPVFAQAAPVAPEAKQGDAKTDSADVACAGAAAYSGRKRASGPCRAPGLDEPAERPAAALHRHAGSRPTGHDQRQVGAAHGHDFDEMRRGGPPQQLEEESGSRIRWDKHLGALPRTILIVGDDRPEPIARLRFVACTNIPKVAPAGDRAVRPRGPNAGAKPPRQARTRALSPRGPSVTSPRRKARLY